MYSTPILFILFNRVDTTKIVFNEIIKIKPQKLFIAADGPRKEKTGEAENCAKIREWVINNIDWECEVHTLFREENLGCKMAVSSAISWFFDHVEAGIILEDDCLPSPDFFHFCSELLIKYENDLRVNFISGTCLPNSAKHIMDASYYFSKFSIIWGWATWRRVWKQYDVQIREWKALKNSNWLLNVFYGNQYYANYFKGMFDIIENGFDTWDFQLFFLNMRCNALNIHPTKNLISNIGFNSEATHTHTPTPYANLPLENIENIIHPKVFAFDFCADEIIFKLLYDSSGRRDNSMRTLYRKIKSRIRKMF